MIDAAPKIGISSVAVRSETLIGGLFPLETEARSPRSPFGT